jgi:hypothetical protein
MDTMTRTMTTSRTTLLTLRSPTSSDARPVTSSLTRYPLFSSQASFRAASLDRRWGTEAKRQRQTRHDT